jgi:hypothetical protein|tara:strand:+ start:20850 stop:21449 length:600 start_codon:yes stop_codon:yes gene_type:complete
MKYKNYLSTLALAAILLITIASCKNEPQEYSEDPDKTLELNAENDIIRGKYLVGIMGCNDCHSPKRMGENGPEIIPELLLSGYPSERPVVNFDSPLLKEGFGMFYPDLTAAAGPWGISFAGNLTPDATGIGNWTEEQFKIALTQGKFKGLENARMLLPPMPWLNYSEMKDEDIRAVFKYLQSIDPVENVVPAPVSPENM